MNLIILLCMLYVNRGFGVEVSTPVPLSRFCKTWSQPSRHGFLPTAVDEASGLAPTHLKDQLLWLNDNIVEGTLHLTDLSGHLLKTFYVPDFKAYDSEALSPQECDGGKTCVWLADSGDNREKRKIIRISLLKMSSTPKLDLKLIKHFKLRYPDGALDAEAFLSLPGGDLYVVTKNISLVTFQSGPARVYKLRDWRNLKAGPTHTLQFVAELPIPSWFPAESALGQAVTDMAYDPTRQVIGLLTYSGLVEIKRSAWEQMRNPDSWTAGDEYQRVPMKALTQQETMTYLSNPNRLLWSSERVLSAAPIFSMTCQDEVR